MDKFNLTFNGELLPGHDLAEVKARFSEALGLDGSNCVDGFFSGKTVTLRRDVDRSTAEAFYTKMYHAGVIVKLQPIAEQTVNTVPKRGMNREFHRGDHGSVEQSWPVRSPKSKKPGRARAEKRGNAVLQAEESQRRAAKVAARKAQKEVAQKQAVEEATRRKAEEQVALKKVAEEAARKKTAEETARKKAVEAAARKKAAEEEARKKAVEEAAKKKAAEEAARKKSVEEATRKKVAEEEARRKAAEEAARKKVAEEVARKKATETAARKKVAEEAARKKATAAAARKKARKEAARKKAAEEAAKKKAAEEATRKKAAEDAAIKTAQVEAARRKSAQEAEQQKALKLAAKKETAEKAARLRAELAEQKRQHAEEAARARADEKRIEDKLRALAAAQQAEEVALLAAQKQQQRQAEKQKVKEQAAAARREKLAQQRAAEQRAEQQRQEQAALDRAAEGTARLEKLQQAVRAKQALNRDPLKQLAEQLPRCQPGAPNLFSLKPFRNTVDVRQRAENSQRVMKTMYITSVTTLLMLFILGTGQALLPPPEPLPAAAQGIILAPHSGLLLTVGKHIFTLDRAGVDSGDFDLGAWGVSSQIIPLGFNSIGKLLLQEHLAPEENSDPNNPANSGNTWRTLSCDTQLKHCSPLAQEVFNARISSYVVDSRTGESYLSSPVPGLLTKLAADGALLSQASVAMPDTARIVLHEGLLYMSSAAGPAISVFRPDDKGFGEQLDEVLLLPPGAVDKGQTQVDDFLWSAGGWWVTLSNPESQRTDLYRFDPKWNFIAAVPLSEDARPAQLLNWANKVLLLDSSHTSIHRFDARGKAEAPLLPSALEDFLNRAASGEQQSQRLWSAGLVFLALLGIGSYLLGRLYQLRSLVYNKDKVRGADAIDDKEKHIHWIDPEANRRNAYQKIAIAYGILCLVVFAVIVILTLPSVILLATALLLAGPAIALALLWTGPIGHIGVMNGQLILVDQNSLYHIGNGARVHYRNNFLLLDDVVVFIGTQQLPVFSTKKLAAEIVPMAVAGVKVDRKTVAIKLMQGAHPLAKGFYACAACLAAAILSFLL